MPSLASYVRLAPFSIDELVDAANSVLRDRPRLYVARRTVRYYVTEGVLPRPGGSPKFARYDVEHLLRLVGTRCLVDLGRTLHDCRSELDELLSFGKDEATKTIQGYVDAPVKTMARQDQGQTDRPLELERQPLMERVEEPRPLYQDGLVLRTALGPGFVLESPPDLPREAALNHVLRLIEQALRPT